MALVYGSAECSLAIGVVTVMTACAIKARQKRSEIAKDSARKRGRNNPAIISFMRYFNAPKELFESAV